MHASVTVMILPVDLIGAPEKLIETLEQEWRDTDTAVVLYDEDKPSPCIRLRRDTLDTRQAYVDNGGRRLLELYTLIGARSVVVLSTWLIDADTPEGLALTLQGLQRETTRARQPHPT